MVRHHYLAMSTLEERAWVLRSIIAMGGSLLIDRVLGFGVLFSYLLGTFTYWTPLVARSSLL